MSGAVYKPERGVGESIWLYPKSFFPVSQVLRDIGTQWPYYATTAKRQAIIVSATQNTAIKGKTAFMGMRRTLMASPKRLKTVKDPQV